MIKKESPESVRPSLQSQVERDRADWEGMGQSRHQPDDKPGIIKIDWKRWNKISDWLRLNGLRALSSEIHYSPDEIQHFNDTLATMEVSTLGLEDIISCAKIRSEETKA